MNWPTVSIVIPAWNAGKYVYECLYTAIHQTLPGPSRPEPLRLYPGLEIVVADDGSTDDTVFNVHLAEKDMAEALERFRKFRPVEGEGAKVLVVQMGHRGYAAAFNAALDAASGEVIARLDADDFIPLGRTAKCVEVLKTEQADIVSSEMTLLDEARNFLGETHVGGMVEAEYVQGGNKEHGPCNPTLVAWRRVYEQVGPFSTDPRWEWSPDSEWNFRALRARMRWAHTGESPYFYRIHPDRMTTRGGDKGHQAYLEQIREHLKMKEQGAAIGA